MLKTHSAIPTHSLGNGEYNDIRDIVYVDPKTFEPNKMALGGRRN